MTSTPEHNALTIADIAAIKNAIKNAQARRVAALGSGEQYLNTAIVADWRIDRPAGERGRISIQTSVSLLPNTPDVQHIEIYHYIPVVCFVVDHGYENPNRVVASQPHYSFDFSVLTGLHNLARVGDQLTVRFQLANNTTTMETHGLCHDSCFVQIIRKGKILTEMLLSDSVAPKYAWGGRMIDNYYRPTPVVADQEQCSI